jgi:hypothetical protein
MSERDQMMDAGRFRAWGMNEPNYHQCPVGGCNQRVRFDQLMCSYHWLIVPAALRRDVVQSWNRGHVRKDYWERRQLAIDTVNGRVGS